MYFCLAFIVIDSRKGAPVGACVDVSKLATTTEQKTFRFSLVNDAIFKSDCYVMRTDIVFPAFVINGPSLFEFQMRIVLFFSLFSKQ